MFNSYPPEKIRIGRLALKIIACAAMLVDHICLVFFSGSYHALLIRGTVGRIAFPLFCFMLCEGFFHTSNIRKYLRNLIIAAIISEPIYDMAFSGTFFDPSEQNVIFTLVLALIMYIAMDHLKSKILLQLLVVFAFAAAAYFTKVDYVQWGIMTCAVFYFFHGAPNYLSGLSAGIPLIMGYFTYGALLCAIPLFFYDEKKGGRLPSVFKYLFYAFYPAHLAIIALIYFLL